MRQRLTARRRPSPRPQLLVVFAAWLQHRRPDRRSTRLRRQPSDDRGAAEDDGEDAGDEQEWFDQADYDKQDEQRSATFEGDPATPWLQYIDGEMTDTSEFEADGAKKACFANASISNPWRQTGWITMNQQLKALQDEGVISEMETRDAGDDDNTQIADIDYFIAEGNCDAFIISPNSTAAMTAGGRAGVRDRQAGRRLRPRRARPTAPPRSSTRSVATRGASTPPTSSSTTSRRATRSSRCASCPASTCSRHRWAAAEKIFDENGIEAVDYFTGADPTEIKKIITDELDQGRRPGRLDGRR